MWRTCEVSSSLTLLENSCTPFSDKDSYPRLWNGGISCSWEASPSVQHSSPHTIWEPFSCVLCLCISPPRFYSLMSRARSIAWFAKCSSEMTWSFPYIFVPFFVKPMLMLKRCRKRFDAPQLRSTMMFPSVTAGSWRMHISIPGLALPALTKHTTRPGAAVPAALLQTLRTTPWWLMSLTPCIFLCKGFQHCKGAFFIFPWLHLRSHGSTMLRFPLWRLQLQSWRTRLLVLPKVQSKPFASLGSFLTFRRRRLRL